MSVPLALLSFGITVIVYTSSLFMMTWWKCSKIWMKFKTRSEGLTGTITWIMNNKRLTCIDYQLGLVTTLMNLNLKQN